MQTKLSSLAEAVIGTAIGFIAAVLTHLRTQWGNQANEVTPLQVNRIRAAQGH